MTKSQFAIPAPFYSTRIHRLLVHHWHPNSRYPTSSLSVMAEIELLICPVFPLRKITGQNPLFRFYLPPFAEIHWNLNIRFGIVVLHPNYYIHISLSKIIIAIKGRNINSTDRKWKICIMYPMEIDRSTKLGSNLNNTPPIHAFRSVKKSYSFIIPKVHF